MYTLLLIDDDEEMLDIHQKYFARKGFEVHTAAGAEAGLGLLAQHGADCILLDVMMPGVDGFETCRRLREKTDAPILFLTGKLAEEDKVKGLLEGGDDYIAKPCGLPELEARVLANIRRSARSAPAQKPMRLSFPPLEIDIEAHQAYCEGESLQLAGREYEILYLLAGQPGQAVTYEDIAQRMWGSYQEDDRRSVMVSVSRLRKKMEAHAGLVGMVETVWGKGYRFVVREKHG